MWIRLGFSSVKFIEFEYETYFKICRSHANNYFYYKLCWKWNFIDIFMFVRHVENI